MALLIWWLFLKGKTALECHSAHLQICRRKAKVSSLSKPTLVVLEIVLLYQLTKAIERAGPSFAVTSPKDSVTITLTDPTMTLCAYHHDGSSGAQLLLNVESGFLSASS